MCWLGEKNNGLLLRINDEDEERKMNGFGRVRIAHHYFLSVRNAHPTPYKDVKIMPQYLLSRAQGATYFFTVVSYNRRPILCDEVIRQATREAVKQVRHTHPFDIEAWVTLPDHIHALWTLPQGDHDFGKRWGLIKSFVSKQCLDYRALKSKLSPSNIKRFESGIWQRRFWEHQIRDEVDFANHMDYLHFNPAKHGLVKQVADWPYSSFHRHVAQGVYAKDWAALLAEDSMFGE